MVVYIKILCKLKLERMDQMEDVEKLELTRYLRQEQNLNRMKVKNQGKTFCTERVKTVKCCMETMVWNWQNMTESGSRGIKGPMFGLRLAVSLMLFAGVIYLDKNQD